MDTALLLTSFAAGVLIGLTSIGGGALMAPLLVLVVGVRPVVAVGTNLAYGAVTKALGGLIHLRQDCVDLSLARRLAWGSLPGGILGSLLVAGFHRNGFDVDQNVRRAMGAVLVLVAVNLLVHIRQFSSIAWINSRLPLLPGWCVTGWGSAVGFCVGLTSVGSGSLIAPFLMLVCPRLPPAKVVGTDVFHAAILVGTTALLHAGTGTVEWRLVLVLLSGSIPGVVLGSLVAPKMPARMLRPAIALLILGTGIKMV